MIEEECMVANHISFNVREQESMHVYLHHGGEHKGVDGIDGMKNVKEEQVASNDMIADGNLNVNLSMCSGDNMKIMDVNFRCSVKTPKDVEAYTNHLKNMMLKCLGCESDSIEGTKLNGECIQAEYTSIGDHEMEVEEGNSQGSVDEEEVLIRADQEKSSYCCEEDSAMDINTIAAGIKLWFSNEGPLAGVFSKGVYYEDEDSWWWQQGANSEDISYASKEYYLLILFERNDITYLSRIMQNFIFDPGG